MLKKQIRKEWTAKQTVIDIERQLQGQGFEEIVADTSSPPQRPAQKRLIAALTAPDDSILEEYYKRRDDAIDAIVAYCFVQEGRTPRRTNAASRSTHSSHPSEPPVNSPVYVAALSVFVKSEKERLRQCFICIGEALSLELGDPRIDELIHELYSPSDLSRHFQRKHLSHLQDIDEIQYQVCNMELKHKMHLQNHTLQIHGTVS